MSFLSLSKDNMTDDAVAFKDGNKKVYFDPVDLFDLLKYILATAIGVAIGTAIG